MNIIEFGAEFLTGIEARYYDDNKGDEDQIGFLIDELLSYVIYHFNCEENLMRKSKYADYENHARTHDKFIQYIKNSKKELDSGKKILGALITSLKSWTETHIIACDKNELAPYLKSVNQVVLEKTMKQLENDMNPKFGRKKHSFMDGIVTTIKREHAVGLAKKLSFNELPTNNSPGSKYMYPCLFTVPVFFVIVVVSLACSAVSFFWPLLFPILPVLFVAVIGVGVLSLLCYFNCFENYVLHDLIGSVSEVIDNISEMKDMSESKEELRKIRSISGNAKLSRSVDSLLIALENYSKYIPVDFLQSVVRKNEIVAPGLETRYITIMFNDIANFTTFCETIDPKRLILFLKMFYKICDYYVWKFEGTVISQTGDGIMAVWNAPRFTLEHEKKSIQCALFILHKLREKLFSNPLFCSENPQLLDLRCGINSSSCLVGNTGSKNRLSYNVFGDSVNTASLLEAAGKIYGANILISKSTYAGLSHKEEYLIRWVDGIVVKGRSKPITAYAIQDFRKKGIRRKVSQQMKKNERDEDQNDEDLASSDEESDEYVKNSNDGALTFRCKLCGFVIERVKKSPHHCEKCGAVGKAIWEKIGGDDEEVEGEGEEEKKNVVGKEEKIRHLSFDLKEKFEKDDQEGVKKVCMDILAFDQDDLPSQIILRRFNEKVDV